MKRSLFPLKALGYAYIFLSTAIAHSMYSTQKLTPLQRFNIQPSTTATSSTETQQKAANWLNLNLLWERFFGSTASKTDATAIKQPTLLQRISSMIAPKKEYQAATQLLDNRQKANEVLRILFEYPDNPAAMDDAYKLFTQVNKNETECSKIEGNDCDKECQISCRLLPAVIGSGVWKSHPGFKQYCLDGLYSFINTAIVLDDIDIDYKNKELKSPFGIDFVKDLYEATPEYEATIENEKPNVLANVLSCIAILENEDPEDTKLLPKLAPIINALIDLGCDVNARGRRFPPLFSAVLKNDPELIKLLVERGAHIDQVAEEVGIEQFNPLKWPSEALPKDLTALMVAIISNKNHAFDTLLTLGANLNGTNEMPEKPATKTPLIVATLYQDASFLPTLIKNGADVNLRIPGDEGKGITPLTEAIENKNYIAFYALLNAGADYHFVDTDGNNLTDLVNLRYNRPDISLIRKCNRQTKRCEYRRFSYDLNQIRTMLSNKGIKASRTVTSP